MAGRLEGRRILVTGGASGIGRATAERFVTEGAKVTILDLDPAAVAKQLGVEGVAADVTDDAGVQRAVEAAARTMDGLDGLVNAAGIFRFTPLGKSTSAEWLRILDVNLVGPARVSRAALPFLRTAKGSTIVNIASIQGLRPSARSGAYAASKAGLIGLTRSMAAELSPKVRVNCVCPGSIDTPMLASVAGEHTPDVSNFLVPRLGGAEEIASGILYLTSNESAYVTGIALPVDGGRSLH
jgi:NAD(P)-dependent dehydrogenase (short-subunit alcohol dehydrogenase family)